MKRLIYLCMAAWMLVAPLCAQTGKFLPEDFNPTTGCILQSAATTNATNCKASQASVWGVRLVNTTTTIYYLRLYNLAAAPTCSSATGFMETIPDSSSCGGRRCRWTRVDSGWSHLAITRPGWASV
jgi:hypothetical protein